MKKNHNAKLVEEMIDIIDSSRIHFLTDEEFKEHQKGIVKNTIEYQDSIGNSKFGTCKELKEYIINEKINDIENDFKN